ncbi:MAG TPA: hypothetical protein VGG85_04300 [Terracidiphilus sp.]|jgi:hypothetical protein
MVRTFSLVAMVLMFCAGALADTDPFIGKWKLDMRRSKYPAGSCPKTMVIVMEAAEQGVWYHSDAVYNNGGEIHAQYTAGYDGKEAMVMSARGFLLPVSLKREGPRVVVASYSRGMQVVAISRRVVSKDGKFMTITTTSSDASGKKTTTVGVYVRQ